MTTTRTTNPVESKFVQFLTLSAQTAALKKRADALKKELTEFAEEHGETDEEKGHRILELDTPIEVAGKRYRGFMRQRRVAQAFNEGTATELLIHKGIPNEDWISVAEYVDQDKVYRLYADEVLTDEEMRSLLDTTETWAFVPVKED